MSLYHNFNKNIFARIFRLESTSLIFFLLLIFTHINAQNIPDLIFTQVPENGRAVKSLDHTPYSTGNQYLPGCRIVSLLSNSKKPINLTSDFYSASDPEISFDGNYIIFSGKKNAKDFWQIWQMKVDGSDKRQITKEAGDCYMPVFAGNRFYLDDPIPTPQIIYVGTAHSWKNNIESGPVYSLYGTDITGSAIHRLTYNLFSDFAPDVLPDGRIVFSSIQFSDCENLSTGKMAFFAINNDGTDLMPYYGNHEGPIYKNDIHISDIDQHCYFIESNNSDYFGGGNIAYLSQRRPLHSYRKVTESTDGYYKNPCSLPDGDMIVSFRTEKPEDVYSLYQLNSETGEQKEILKTPSWHNLDAQISRPHPKVKGRSNWLIPGAVTGVFYCLNSYKTSLSRDIEVNPGDFKFVRVIEGLPIENETKSELPNMQFAPARIIGVAPVEKDGSFQVRVPAEIPISFQMLDENKMAIDRHDTWTWVIGNENRGCIGCHENRELTPVNKLVDAVTKPPVELIPDVEDRRTVDFRHQIAPIIRTKCATEECHVSGKTNPNLEENNNFDVYTTLLKPINSRESEAYVQPGLAKKSPLIWHLFGERLLSQKDNYTSAISLMPPKTPLSENEIQLFIEWIDMGAQWDLKLNSPANSNKN